jgi:dihydrofolate reductase
LAVDYIPYWLDVVTKPDDPMYELAYRIAVSKKIIFTKTLKNAKWKNTVLAEGNLSEEIKRLKSQSGKDIIVYGGTSFVASLVKENLIDEYHLFVNPAALGKGESVFHQLKNIRQMKLNNSIAYPSGIVLLNFSVN